VLAGGGALRSRAVGPFAATLIAALVAGLVAREALDLPLVAAMAIALVAGLAADYAVRRRTRG
jgi:membrane protease YdiL (CAAX protease family)